MPVDGDINIDMPTTRDLVGATSQVPMGVSEAYRGDAYDPKSIVMPPSSVPEHKDLLSGGLADNKSPEDFDSEALRMGTEVELEHTGNKALAQEIAMDHLTEDPKYYEKLKNMESMAARKEILLSLAVFPNRKDIAKNNPDKTDIINKINEKLSFLGNKSAKYFGVVWDHVEKGNFQNVDEKIFDVIQYIEVTLDLPEFDINVFNTFEEFRAAAHNIRMKKQQERLAKEQNKEKEKMLGGVKESAVLSSLEAGNNTKIFEDETNIVFRVNNVHGANALASDTTWCIARVGSPFYDQYTSSNLIFYFAIDKTRELNDPFQKMSIRVMKYEDQIEDIRVTRKTNDSDDRDPEEVPGYEKFKNIIKDDAKKQPEGLLSKVARGAATEEEVKKLWNNHFLASNEEKKYLLNHIDDKYHSLPEIQHFLNLKNKQFSEEELSKINLKSLDAATLEKIAEQTENQNLLKKLYKLNYIPVQVIVARKVENLKLLYELSFNNNEMVLDALVTNPNMTIELLRDIKGRVSAWDDESIREAVGVHLSVKENPYAAIKTHGTFIKYIKNPPEDLQLIAVKQDYWAIRNIKNPTEKVQLETVKQNGTMLRYIKNPTEEIQLEAVKQQGAAINLIDNPSEEMQLEAVAEDSSVIRLIKNPTEKVQLKVVMRDGYKLQYIKNPTKAAQLAAIKQNGAALGYIKNPPEEWKLIAVKNNGLAIAYIENPTEEVKLEAVKENCSALKYIRNPSEEIQLAAVRRGVGAPLYYIDNPTEKVQLEAVTILPRSIIHIKNPSEEIQLVAVRKDGLVIEHIKTPSEKVKLEAVKQNGLAIEHIKTPSEELQLEAVKQNGLAIARIWLRVSIYGEGLRHRPSEAVQLAAVRQDGNAIRFIRDPSEELQLAAINQNWLSIKYIKNPSEQAQIAAVKLDGRAIEHIENPSEEVKRIAQEELVKLREGPPSVDKHAVIKEISGGRFRVYDKNGINKGTYSSRAQAKKRLNKIEQFKKTASVDLSYSYMMRELRENHPKKLKKFMKVFKEAFDEAFINDIEDLENVSLMEALKAINYKGENDEAQTD